MKLTRDFDASEFDTAREPWPAGKDANRAALALRAQWLRDLAGSLGIITSAHRSGADNTAVGGSESSQHMKAEAIDILFPLSPLRALAEKALADVAAGKAPTFGQLIFYVRAGHVHVSLATLGARNGEILIADDAKAPTRYAKLTDADQLPAVSLAQAGAATLLFVSVGIAVLLLGGES